MDNTKEQIYNINYYEIFNILPNATNKEIVTAYENKIKIYNKIKNLSKEQIYNIKILKVGLYILSNLLLRNKYDKIINENSLNSYNENSYNENSLNDLKLFNNVDSKFDKKEDSIISDRIFSLSNFNKRPGFSTDSELTLRKPIQCRDIKTKQPQQVSNRNNSFDNNL